MDAEKAHSPREVLLAYENGVRDGRKQLQAELRALLDVPKDEDL